MIEAISKIPDGILDGQLEESLGQSKEGERYIVVFLDNDFNIEKIEEGNYEKICEKNPQLSDLQKGLIKNFQKYRGVIDFGKNCNRYAIGGNQALATLSLLHYNFSNGGKIHNNLFKKKSSENIDNILKKLDSKEEIYIKIREDYPGIVDSFKKILKNLFIEVVLEEKNYEGFEFDKNKIVIIPKENSYIEEYKKLWKMFTDFKAGKREGNLQNFNIDTFGKDGQIVKHKALYSKFGKAIVFQKEGINMISTEEYEKIDKIKKILNSSRFKGVIPLPLFEADTNIYQICFNDGSLLKKLQEIYTKNNHKPFNYVLISSNNDGYRFENIINFDFNIDSLINKEIYKLKFNEYKPKEEVREVIFDRLNHDKFELLFDIASLFWVIKDEEKNEYRQMSFFRPEIKNNTFLDRKLKENSESIINQIFKKNNEFINFRLQKIINSTLNEIIHSGETQKQFSSPFWMKKLLLLSLKYERKKEKMKTKELKEIENKLKKFKEGSSLNEIRGDFEAYLYAGLIFKHIVSASASGKTDLELASKYLLSLSTTNQLKEKIALLATQYSHNLKVNPKMWNEINKGLLEHEFKDEKVKNNLVPFFIGYYSDFWLSKPGESKQENLNNGESN